MTITTDTLVQRRDEAATRAAAILDGAELERRSLTTVERAEHDGLVGDVAALGTRVEELRAAESSAERAARARVEVGETGQQRTGPVITGIREPATYTSLPSSPSFVLDLYRSRQGDLDAAQRLQRNQQERNVEQRALGNSGASGGAGGEWARPLWLENEGVLVARAGRVVADRCVRNPLPSGVSTINIPKLNGGTVTAPQSTQNTVISSVDPSTSYLSSGITTIAGSNVISLQLIQQSTAGAGFDQIVLADLSADLARNVDRQVLSGTGTAGQILGLLNVPGIQLVPYTQATPSVTGVGGLYAKVNQAISLVASTRYLPADAIVMRPERWSAIAASFDSTGRPLVSPSGNAFNQVADASTGVAAQGIVGSMAGLPVWVDSNLPLNGSSQDPMLVCRFADLYIWESDVTLATFDQPFANSLGVLVRAHQYLSAIMSRYPASIAVIQGTGTAPPVW